MIDRRSGTASRSYQHLTMREIPDISGFLQPKNLLAFIEILGDNAITPVPVGAVQLDFQVRVLTEKK